jgi:hypothetical protein
MKTLQQITQKTKNYNPKKSLAPNTKSEKKTESFAQGDFLWQAYLSTREGTFAEDLKKVSLVTFRRYAENGCYRAQLVLEKFEKFVQTCQTQIGQEILSLQNKQNSAKKQTTMTSQTTTKANSSQPSATAPSYDQCRLSAYAAYSMKVRLMAERRAANASRTEENLLAQAA